MLNKTVILSLLAMGFLAGCSKPADEKYLTIGSVEVAQMTEQKSVNDFSANLSSDAIGSAECSNSNANFSLLSKGTGLDDLKNPLDPLDQFDVELDKVINIGKKIWAIVEAGRPVANFKSDVATALPSGSRCWTDLSGWSRPQSQTWGITFKNLYGIEVTKLVYRVVYLPGGSVDGQGKYIGYATVLPVEVNVAWGYTFNANVSVPTVFNMGTVNQPKAGMQLNVNWTVSTVLKHTEQTQSYFVSGTGEFQKLK